MVRICHMVDLDDRWISKQTMSSSRFIFSVIEKCQFRKFLPGPNPPSLSWADKCWSWSKGQCYNETSWNHRLVEQQLVKHHFKESANRLMQLSWNMKKPLKDCYRFYMDAKCYNHPIRNGCEQVWDLYWSVSPTSCFAFVAICHYHGWW